MLDATEKTGLDAIQIAALRKADTVCFFHRAVPDLTGETSYIGATKKHKPSASNPFAPSETQIVIPCDFRLREYSRGDEKIAYGVDNWHGFEWIGSAQFDEEWRTIVSLLRVGDKLTLLWQRGAWTNESMKNATPQFFGDSLSLIVERGKATLQFHIDTSFCENNSARMVRKN